MKVFEFDYDWTWKNDWLLPQGEEMMQAQFPILDEQIDTVLSYTPKRRICIQAGGAFGLYPLRLAYYFHRVHTFEPLLDNFICLVENIEPHRDNIEARQIALLDEPMSVSMDYSKPKKNSYGAHHISYSTRGKALVEARTIDSYEIESVDLIWLDIEGAEALALQGAAETIDLWRPTVVIEERPLPGMAKIGTRAGQARSFLRRLGYKEVARSHGDVIFR